MTFISYAQNFEDLMLYRALKGVVTGFYIDVGASDPVLDSVTKAFYERGWTGINIEPEREVFRKLCEDRRRDINLRVAMGERAGSGTLFDLDVRGHATSDGEAPAEKRASGRNVVAHEVQVRTLTDVCSEHVRGDIHFLKIDVEGWERQVLAGMDFGRFRPWIIVIEAAKPGGAIKSHADWETLLTHSNYVFAFFDGLNRYYIAAEHRELEAAFTSPPNVFDDAVKFREIEVQQELSRTRETVAAQEADLSRAQETIAAQEEVIANLQDERQAVYSSTSWRITQPLRWAKFTVQRIATRLSPLTLSDAVRLQLRKLVVRAADVVSRNEGIRRTAISLIRTFPGIELRLRAIISASRSHTFKHGPVSEHFAGALHESAGAAEASEEFVFPLPVGQRTFYVFVDHTVACPTNTGMQRVARRLASALLQAGENVRFVKWDEEYGGCVLINRQELEHLAQWTGPQPAQTHKEVYPNPGERPAPVSPGREGENNWLIVPEVPHITYHPEPVTLRLLTWARQSHFKCGFVFYDAIPLRRPELEDMAAKHAQYMQQLLLADVVWPISSWSAEDLLAYWIGHEKATTDTMPEVMTLSLPGESQIATRVLNPESGGKVILSVGSVEPRKNQLNLIAAFEKFLGKHESSGWRLVLVGNLHPLVAAEVARAKKRNPAIRHLGHVSDAELDALYRTCSFTVFPSVEEGFGLPILESLWYAKPCICANFGAMAEVARGGGCITVDTRSVDAIADAIERLACSPNYLRSVAVEAAARRISSWDEYAGQLIRRIDLAADFGSRLGTIYYFIEHTAEFPKNTGIQRVARQLARALLELGVQVIPAKWCPHQRKLIAVTDKELEHFAKWNGPKPEDWSPWVEPAREEKDGWFFMPELPLHRSQKERAAILDYAGTRGLRKAALFFDAIPWKLRSTYPEQFASAHREYMEDLNRYDLVLPISDYSREDLLNFLGRHVRRVNGLEGRIKTAALPTEFPEAPRVRNASEQQGEVLRFLCVGTVEPRKNHITLLDAFESAQRSTKVRLHLTIVGGSHSIDPSLAEAVRARTRQNAAMLWEEDADDKRLHELHMACDVTVYPSVEEGFGLPIAESLWYAKPCICANFGAMKEVAKAGGCLTVDVRSTKELSAAIVRLAENRELRKRLSDQATSLRFKSWHQYASEIAARMAEKTTARHKQHFEIAGRELEKRLEEMRLPPRPLLSICVTTYNRAGWLSANLRNWARLYPKPLTQVEFLVCDNTSTDTTPDVVKPYLSRPDFSYYRNTKNVGMLGNLRETANHARGQFVWIIGDDDLLMPRSIERVLNVLHGEPDVALLYLNYAYTRTADVRSVDDFEAFFRDAKPIVPPGRDVRGPIRTICARNENFFTAIYALVFRRDHAIKAYSQDTSGRPFSTMLTAIPTTYHVLHNMMEQPGYWIGEPQLVVNMNVSWLRYAPLWILERIPEVYELAEQKGGPREQIDRWRRHTLSRVPHYLREIFENDPLGNAAFFSPRRLVWRFKHLPEFGAVCPMLKKIYTRAHADGCPSAKLPPHRIFPDENPQADSVQVGKVL